MFKINKTAEGFATVVENVWEKQWEIMYTMKVLESLFQPGILEISENQEAIVWELTMKPGGWTEKA